MLRITRLTLARGTLRLLEEASLVVHPGQKVGVVGANGSGKSSLFAMLRSSLESDAGSVSVPPAWVIAHVAQETPASDAAAIDFVLDGDVELRSIERELEAAHSETTPSAADADARGEEIAELHHRFDAIDGYSARARAATLLSGLGVDESRHRNPVTSFSGGWRMRLNLAQALMCRSDLLLLDEPTNHLDLDAVLWLEEWLKRYRGTLLLITHDRDVLDHVANVIVHFESRKLKTYSGNYEQFERQRAASLALQQSAYVKQQREVAHLHAFVERFRAKATKAKQAQSRIKALERMEMIAAAHVDTPFSFAFPATPTHARQLLSLEQAQIGHAGKPVLARVDWSILAGARIGLLGPNGAGKSTLLAAVAGSLALLKGERHAAQDLRIGYFAQHQVDQLRLEHSALWHLQRLEPAARDQDLRDYIGGFDFRGERVNAPVAEFSGGEKARLTLALLVRARPNLLLLDEPTNHLDIEMREALTEALQDYEGALVVVAHDRHLLRATTDELWLVDAGALAPFEGDLDDYRQWVLSRRSSDVLRIEGAVAATLDDPVAADDKADTTTLARKAQKRAEAEERQRRFEGRKPLVKAIAKLETEIAALGADKRTLDDWLALPDAYEPEQKQRLTEALSRQVEIASKLERAEARWLELHERLDRLES